jgi:hypothetical protein
VMSIMVPSVLVIVRLMVDADWLVA